MGDQNKEEEEVSAEKNDVFTNRKVLHHRVTVIIQNVHRHRYAIIAVVIAFLCMGVRRSLISTSSIINLSFSILIFLMKCICQTLSLGIAFGLALEINQRLGSSSSDEDYIPGNNNSILSAVGAVSRSQENGANVNGSRRNGESSTNKQPTRENLYNRYTKIDARSKKGGATLRRQAYTGKACDEISFLFPEHIMSPDVAQALGRLTDLIVRDFVKCWYCNVDNRCIYNDPQKRTSESKTEDIHEDPANVSDFILHIHRSLAAVLGAFSVNASEVSVSKCFE